MIGVVLDKRVLGLAALLMMSWGLLRVWTAPPAPSEFVSLDQCAIPRADVEYVSEKFVRVRVKNAAEKAGDQASAGTMLFIRAQPDLAHSTAAVRSANIVDLAPINAEYDISVEPDFPGFTLYQERYGNQSKYYIKDTAPKVVITIDSALGMRVYREMPPAIEVDYVVRRDDVQRLGEIGARVDDYVNAYCRNSVVS
jgi:hypothetical protein